jgi:hypothetical protein
VIDIDVESAIVAPEEALPQEPLLRGWSSNVVLDSTLQRGDIALVFGSPAHVVREHSAMQRLRRMSGKVSSARKRAKVANEISKDRRA